MVKQSWIKFLLIALMTLGQVIVPGISRPASASTATDPIVNLYGSWDFLGSVTLFGNRYGIFAFGQADSAADEKLILPFNVDDEPPTIETLVTDADKAAAILATYAFDKHILHSTMKLPIVQEELQQESRYYDPDFWWAEPVTDLAPDLWLPSKRKVDRVFLGNAAFWGAEEVLNAKVTGGASTVGLLASAVNFLYEQGRLEGIKQEEIQALILTQAIYGGDLDLFETMTFLSSFPNLDQAFKIKEGVDLVKDWVGAAHELSQYEAAVAVGDAVGIKDNKEAFAGEIKGLGIGIVTGLAEDWVFGELLHWTDLKTQANLFAWLHDAHAEALSVVAADLVTQGDRMLALQAESGFTPTKAAALAATQYDFAYRYALILPPLRAEHFGVQLAHLQRVRSHVDAATAWWVGARQKPVAELANDYAIASGDSNEFRNRFERYAIDLPLLQVGYHAAMEALQNQSTNSLLAIHTPGPMRAVYVGETIDVAVTVNNRYAFPVQQLAVASGTEDGIAFSSLAVAEVPAQTAQEHSLQVTVPANWFTVNNAESRVVDIALNATWSVDGNAFTKTFVVPLIVSSRGRIVDITSNASFLTPGDTATVDVSFSTPGGSTPIAVAEWLTPDGTKQSINWNSQSSTQAQLSFTAPQGPYGAYGAQVFLYDQALGEIVVPKATANRLFYVVPEIQGDMQVFDASSAIIVYPADDADAAFDIAEGMSIPHDRMFVIEEQSNEQLQTMASQHDTVLIGGNQVNPLVATLTASGRLPNNLLTEGNAYATILENAFGNRSAFAIAGYSLRDTQTAAIGTAETWAQLVQAGPAQVGVQASPTDLSTGDSATIRATVRDATGGATPGVNVHFSTLHPGVFGSGNCGSGCDTTDVNGQAEITYSPTSAGLAAIYASTDNGASGSIALNVSSSSDLSIQLTAYKIGGTDSYADYTIEAVVTGPNGPIIGDDVCFSTDRADITLSPPCDETGTRGGASTTLQTTSTGPVIVTATILNVATSQKFQLQVGPSPPLTAFKELTAPGTIYAVDFDATGQYLAAGGEEPDVIYIWQTDDWSLHCVVDVDEDVYALKFSPSGTKLAAGIDFGRIGIIDNLDTCNFRMDKDWVGDGGHFADPTAIDWLGESTLVVADDAGKVSRWQLSGSSWDGTLADLGGLEAFELEVSPDRSKFAAAVQDGHLYVWSSSGQQVFHQDLTGNNDEAESVTWSSDGTKLAVGYEAGTGSSVKVYQTSNWSAYPLFTNPQRDVKGLAFLQPDGSDIASGEDAGPVRVWQATTASELRQSPSYGVVTQMDWAPQPQVLAAAIESGKVALFAPYDQQAPRLLITSPEDGSQVPAEQITINGNVSDAYGIVAFTVAINGGAPTSLSTDADGNFSMQVPLAIGQNTFILRAVDGNGNETTLSRLVERMVDENPPLINNVAIAPASGIVGTDFSVTATIVDATGLDPAALFAHVQAPDETDILAVPLVGIGADRFQATWSSSTLAPRLYQVDIVAVDTDGNMRELENGVQFRVEDDIDLPPVARAGNDQQIVAGTPVQFDGSGSLDDRAIVAYHWDVDAADGVDFATPDLTGANPSHVYAQTGSYTVTLQVVDDAGQTDLDTMRVIVSSVDGSGPNWDATLWDGARWCRNRHEGAWMPAAGNGVATLAIDDYCWGQIRTKEQWQLGTAVSMTIVPRLQSGGVNKDGALLGFSTGYANYAGSMAGVVLEDGKIKAWATAGGILAELGTYTPSTPVTLDFEWSATGALRITGAFGTYTLNHAVMSESQLHFAASNRDSSDGFDIHYTEFSDVDIVPPLQIDLAPGWNLVSLPLASDMPIEEVLTSASEHIDRVLGEDGIYVTSLDTSFNTLHTINGGAAYYIHNASSTVVTLNIAGTPPTTNTPIQLHQGWNWMGYLPADPLPVATALQSIDGLYQWVLSIDQAYSPTLPEFKTLAQMERGQGYLIYMNEAAELVYPDAVAAAGNLPLPVNYTGSGCHRLQPTPSSMLVYGALTVGGAPAPLGTRVEVLTPSSDMAGCVEVTTAGQYGLMHVYGADKTADPPMPGFVEGELLRFRVAGTDIEAAATITWSDDKTPRRVSLVAPTPVGMDIYLPAISSDGTVIGADAVHMEVTHESGVAAVHHIYLPSVRQ